MSISQLVCQAIYLSIDSTLIYKLSFFSINKPIFFNSKMNQYSTVKTKLDSMYVWCCKSGNGMPRNLPACKDCI